MMDTDQFKENRLFVIDCSHQPETIISSTVDIKVEFSTRRVYAIIHDTYWTYNVLDGWVTSI